MSQPLSLFKTLVVTAVWTDKRDAISNALRDHLRLLSGVQDARKLLAVEIKVLNCDCRAGVKK